MMTGHRSHTSRTFLEFLDSWLFDITLFPSESEKKYKTLGSKNRGVNLSDTVDYFHSTPLHISQNAKPE